MLAAQGVPQSQIAAMGFGPAEFLRTAGNPAAKVNMFDLGLYVQDDWRIKRNLSLSEGFGMKRKPAFRIDSISRRAPVLPGPRTGFRKPCSSRRRDLL